MHKVLIRSIYLVSFLNLDTELFWMLILKYEFMKNFDGHSKMEKTQEKSLLWIKKGFICLRKDHNFF